MLFRSDIHSFSASTISMHVALQTEDILNEVFERLNPPLRNYEGHVDYERGPDSHTLKVLHDAALVCKAFSGPALKQLWAHVPRLDPLFCLLPSSAKLFPDTAVPGMEGLGFVEGRLCIRPNFVWVCDLRHTLLHSPDKSTDHGRPHHRS